MPVEPGQDLLHYRIIEKIGEGGMGVVWKAEDTSLGRDVAIKVLPATWAGDAERLQRSEREARLLASLNHPNVATVHGLQEAETTQGSGAGQGPPGQRVTGTVNSEKTLGKNGGAARI